MNKSTFLFSRAVPVHFSHSGCIQGKPGILGELLGVPLPRQSVRIAMDFSSLDDFIKLCDCGINSQQTLKII